MRGSETIWQVTNLPGPEAAELTCGGADFTAWRVIDDSTIEVQSDIDHHVFRVSTGHHGRAAAAVPSQAEESAAGRPGSAVKSLYVPADGAGSSCCG